MVGFNPERIYEALVLPNEAISDGGLEILRAGIIKDKLYVSARRAFKDPAQWGEVLADIARRVAALCAAETKGSRREILTAIEQAFAAELGAPKIKEKRQKALARKTKAEKGKARGRPARKAGRTAARHGKR